MNAPPVFKPQVQWLQRQTAPPVFRPQAQPVQRQAAPPVFRPQAQPVQRQAAPPVFRPQAQPVQRQIAPPVFKPQAQPVQRQAAPPVFRPQAQPAQRTSARHAAIQRKILISNTWYSFEHLYDQYGNPYLISEEGNRKQFEPRVDHDIALSDVKKGEEYHKFESSSRENIYRNFGRGRPMNLKTEGDRKSKYLPFKSYQFDQNTKFEISVYTESGTGKLYPDFESRLTEGLDKQLDSLDTGKNPILKTMSSVKTEMAPIIVGEDYRQPGAIKVFEDRYTTSIDEIEKESERYIKKRKTISGDKKLQKDERNKQLREAKRETKKSLTANFKYVTSELPWAGKRGKSKFATGVQSGDFDSVLGKKDKKQIVTTGEWYGCLSPLREDEEDKDKYLGL